MGQNDDMTIRAPDPGDSDRFNQTPEPEPQDSGFQEAPKFDSTPPPIYSEAPQPTSVPTYGEVVEPPKKKGNKTLWIILAIIVAVICCCCIVAVVLGNNLIKEFNIEDFEDLMNEFSQIIKLAPAFI
jgi:hypothetical protein